MKEGIVAIFVSPSFLLINPEEGEAADRFATKLSYFLKSTIHRAVYVMENFMGIEPTPPPPDVKITEPDIRQAKTIKEILAAHTSDATCASCHQTIDPYGFAFENFGPMGEWRDFYPTQNADTNSDDKVAGGSKPADEPSEKTSLPGKKGESVEKNANHKKQRKSEVQSKLIAVDASAKFRGGSQYRNIVEYRKLMEANAARDRFVRCFITKLSIYANGTEPEDYSELEKILEKSAENRVPHRRHDRRRPGQPPIPRRVGKALRGCLWPNRL